MLKDELRKLLSDNLNVSEAMLTDEVSLSQDLKIDSFEILRLITIIENKYQVEIDESQIDLLDNLNSAYRYIKALTEDKR